MFDDVCFYVGTAFNKPPFIVKGRHPLLGEYDIKLEPEWRVVNKDGEASVEGQKIKGVKVGAVGVVAKVSFPDGSSLETPEITIQVKHLIPTDIFLAPRPA